MTTIVFDVNETLLSLHPLNPLFKEIFGSERLRDSWFNEVLHLSTVTTITGRSQSLTFADVARIALEKLAIRENIILSEHNRAALGQVMRTLPPYPDSVEGLQQLHQAGVRLSVLTNSPQASVDHLMAEAGLDRYLDKILSVQSVGKFKPAIEVYQMAAQQLDENPDDLWMLAAHDWDIEGALHAGWHGAFIQREGKVYHPDAPQADTIQPTITAFAAWYLSR